MINLVAALHLHRSRTLTDPGFNNTGWIGKRLPSVGLFFCAEWTILPWWQKDARSRTALGDRKGSMGIFL